MLGIALPNEGESELLGTFPRPRFEDGPDPKQELRVELSRHAGRCYVSLTLCRREAERQAFPAQGRGFLLRACELAPLAELLAAAAQHPGINAKIKRRDR